MGNIKGYCPNDRLRDGEVCERLRANVERVDDRHCDQRSSVSTHARFFQEIDRALESGKIAGVSFDYVDLDETVPNDGTQDHSAVVAIRLRHHDHSIRVRGSSAKSGLK